MIRLTDRPDMTLDVYRGRKTTIQQQQQSAKLPCNETIVNPTYLDDPAIEPICTMSLRWFVVRFFTAVKDFCF